MAIFAPRICRAAFFLFSLSAIAAHAQGPVAQANRPQATALHHAVETDDIPAATRLIKSGHDVNAVNRYGAAPISIACARGNAAMIELLLNAGADANTALPEGETCLMSAASAGNLAAVNASHYPGGRSERPSYTEIYSRVWDQQAWPSLCAALAASPK